MNLIQSFVSKFKQSKFWTSVISLSLGQVIGQSITLLTTPLVSRLYTNEEYGEFGIISSTATIIVGVVGLGLASSIMIADNDDDAEKVFRVSFFLQIILATIFCAVLIFISPWVHLYSINISYAISILLMYLYIIGSALMTLLNIIINRKKMNNVLFLNPVISAGCTLVITLPFGFFRFGFIGLMLASIVSYFLASIHMLRYCNPFRKRIYLTDISYTFQIGKKFVLYQYPANMIDVVSSQLPNQMLANSFGNDALGSYAMCNKLFNFPMRLIATPIQTVYFRTSAEKYQKKENIAPLTYSLVSKICLISSIPVLMVICFGESVFSFVLGDEWREAGILTGILIIQYVFTFCSNCIVYCRVSIGKQKWNLFATIMQVVIVFLSLFVGYKATRTLTGVLLYYGIFNTVWQIINIEISFICLKKYYIKWLAFSVTYSIIGYLLLLIL